MSVRQMDFWNWGWADEAADEDPAVRQQLADRLFETCGADRVQQLSRPKVEEFDIQAPRVSPPAALADLCTKDPHERLIHSNQ